MEVKNYSIRRYLSTDFEQWNSFIGTAKNSTFLFHRNFMEYHSDRFDDYSLIVSEGENWVAVLPAHLNGDVVSSHQGLTYGGLVYGYKTKVSNVIFAFQALLKFLQEQQIELLHIKMIPSIYHNIPSDELKYALFLANASLVRRDSLSVIDLRGDYSISKTRRESIRRGIKNELIIKEEANFRQFWEEVLEPNLRRKHEVKPVHTLSEIEKLQSQFPQNIRHFNVYHQGKVVAGTTVFESEFVAHPQYISGQANKNELGSLDFLYHHLISNVFSEKRFFDFGISNEEQGRKLNQSLVFWKESFGASTLTQDFYGVPTSNYKLLDNVLI